MSYNDLFLRASKKEQVEQVPVWYMRQAGRYDPEYRKIKEKYSLLEICAQPELAAEVTMMPVRKLGVDAAILYSDIMNPVASLGIDFDIVAGVGPVIDKPIRHEDDVNKLLPFNAEKDLGHVLETIRILDRELQVPLITFTGAPFTIASYLIEGRPSKTYIQTKTMMYRRPEVWFKLMDRLGDMVIDYIRAQHANGAKAVQIFDSWVGSLSTIDYEIYVLPTITRIYEALSDIDIPKIYFPGVASGELFPSLRHLKADVIGVDWRLSLTEARRRLDHRFAVQGNLDPFILNAPMELIKERAKAIIDQGIEEPGYIFNLGHGLFPEASIDTLKELTEFVHTYSSEALKARV